LILQHRRRVIGWIDVTAHPSAEWIAPPAPLRLGTGTAIHRDKDRVYGDLLIRRLSCDGHPGLADRTAITMANGRTERLIASIRRERLDHVVVFGEQHLRQLLGSTKDITMTRLRTYR